MIRRVTVKPLSQQPAEARALPAARPSAPVSPASADPPANHNGGPPLEDPPEHVPEWGDGGPGNYFEWRAAVKRSRKAAPHDIVMFRLSRAEAAGVDYETYVTELLERGRRLQQGDDVEALKQRWKTRGVAKPKPL